VSDEFIYFNFVCTVQYNNKNFSFSFRFFLWLLRKLSLYEGFVSFLNFIKT
jgi:hypothetical protein